MARFQASDVRDYYDRQSRAFLTLGQGAAEEAIHRAVWGPGVDSRSGAFHFVHDRIATLLERIGRSRSPAPDTGAWMEPNVLDLGCGVGGSLMYLARRMPLHGTGITLSGVQAGRANRLFLERGLSDRLSCVEGDFTRLPDGLGPFDLAFAIESFVHAPSPERFFAECRKVLRPQGTLVICDDVRRGSAEGAAAGAIEDFCRGWHVNSLLERHELARLAIDAGFAVESVEDLTPWLELGRPRDRAVAVLLGLLGWLPIGRTPFAHLSGGRALQECLRRGWVGYELACFTRGD